MPSFRPNRARRRAVGFAARAGSAFRLAAALALALAAGCKEPPKTPPADPPPPSDRFLRIRSLLAQPAQSPERARHLYPLTAPLCTPGPERDAFFETAAWSVAQSEGANQLTTVLAVDVFEFVASACSRDRVEAAFEILDRARALVPDDPQLDVVKARLAAAADRFDVAREAARRARDAGSEHAIALLANIQARIARDRVGVGFEPGMFDAAIETVSVEPDSNWQAIDLTAVLSTRARLLEERALWEEEEARRATLTRARATFARLAKAPFVEAVRRSALDHLCFDVPALGADPAPCARAAEEFGSLGGAAIAGVPAAAEDALDRARAADLSRFAKAVPALEPGRTVVLVVRGDESEVVEWARPAAKLLAAVDARAPKWLVVDRTSSERGSAVVSRMLELAGIAAPAVRVTPRQNALASSCLAALVADREKPESCPLDSADVEAVEALLAPAFAVLVGRDLDAELDDLGLYGVPRHLLSFRRTAAKKAPESWFKNLSDVWFVLEPPGR